MTHFTYTPGILRSLSTVKVAYTEPANAERAWIHVYEADGWWKDGAIVAEVAEFADDRMKRATISGTLVDGVFTRTSFSTYFLLKRDEKTVGLAEFKDGATPSDTLLPDGSTVLYLPSPGAMPDESMDHPRRFREIPW